MSRKTGEMWVRRPTETLQYHVDGQTKTVFPEPYATVLDEGIEDGDLVSMVWAADLEKPGVVRTDNTTTDRAYGFARLEKRDPELDPHGALVRGETVIEIQTYGQFEVSFSHFTEDPVHDDIGLGILAVSPQEYDYRRQDGAKPGKITVSRTQATTFGGSVIETGTLSDIDTVNEIATIKVLISGDSRGPVGLTEVEYVSNQIIPTNNTPRIFAYVNNEEPKNHREVFEWHIPDGFALSNFNNAWFALDMFFAHPEDRDNRQKRTLVIYFTTQTDTSSLQDDIMANGLTDFTPGATRHTVPSVNNEGRFFLKNEDSIAFITIPGARNQLFADMIDAINGTMQSVFDYDGTFDPRLRVKVTDDVLEKGNSIATDDTSGSLDNNEDYTLVFETRNSTITGAEQGAVAYIYRSPWIKDQIEFRHYISQYGKLKTDDEFRVVPADRRRHVDGNSSDAPKLVTLAGVLSTPLPMPDQEIFIHRGANVMMQKMGTIDGFSNLKPGRKVYLGYNGHVTQASHDIKFDEYMVEIGVARSETEIDIRISDARLKSTTRDSMPVGVIIPRAYDLSQDPPVPADPPPGFLALEGQTVPAEEYPDLFYALTGEMPHEHSPDITLHDDPSHIIKAHSFNLFPDTATPELPVQSRRAETAWTIIDGAALGDEGPQLTIPHRLKTSIRDIIGYAVISVTENTGAPGDQTYPEAGAPQIIVYPGYGSDGSEFFGFQFNEQGMDSIIAKVGNNGLKVAHDGSLYNVTAAQAANLFAGAENFVIKFVIYKIENIYDFKDDRLIDKANEFWYDHRRRYFWDDEVEVHGVSAATLPTGSTLIRRSSDGRAKVVLPIEGEDIANKTYVDDLVEATDQANRTWTENNLDAHADTETEGIHGSSYSPEGGKLAHRNGDGRTQVANPDNPLDATNKGYVDDIRDTLQDNLDTAESDLQDQIDTLDDFTRNDLEGNKVDPHIANENEGVHGSAVGAEVGKLIHRDSSGRAKVNDPAVDLDIANKKYVDEREAVMTSRVRLPIGQPAEIDDGDLWLEDEE